MHKSSIFTAMTVVVALGLAHPAKAGNNVVFIFDASNSMWAQIDGIAKIETAQGALNEALGELGEDINLGLMAFGHRRSGDCQDIEVLSEIGAVPAAALQDAVAGITPRGRTPLAGSLEESWGAFSGREEENNTVVLISDGIETCGGDPCAIAADLAQRGINVRIHTVGFDVDADAEGQLICIAEAGGGDYFRAEDGPALRTAMAELTEVVQAMEAEPEPEPEPASAVYFHDEFESADLAEEWVVLNPDPNAYIVEAGQLLMTNAGGVKGFRVAETPNIIRLDHPLPDGDWDLIVRLRAELKTLRDSVWFGLYTDSDNFMGGHLHLTGDQYVRRSLTLDLVRRAGGQVTNFPRNVRAALRDAEMVRFLDELAGKSLIFALSKRGREYRAALEIEGESDDSGNPIVYETDALTSLRSPGAPALAVGQWEAAQGETLIYVDSVTIETVN